MRKTFPALVLLLALASLAGLALDNPCPPLKIDRYQLSNGLNVFLVEDHTTPLVAVNINYQVGSKNESPGRTGFAHLFEHMMFQGSKNWNNDYSKPIQEIGGQVNGGTNTDRTRYWDMVPSPYLERALWLEADRMGFLLDTLTQERLDNQRSVVQNERRQRVENQPYGLLEEKISAALYPPHHPYNWTTIGSMEDLSAATLDDVKTFFRNYYSPNNASLCIAGDFDPVQAKSLVEKYFGAFPPGPPVSRVVQWVPPLAGEISLDIQDRVQLPRSVYVWNTVPVYSENDAALDAFGQIFGGGETSRLYRSLVRDKQIAQTAVAFHGGRQIAGTFRMILTPRPGHTTAEVEQAALAVLKETLEQGVTADELERVKTTSTSGLMNSLQNPGGFGGISDAANQYFHYLGDPDRFRWDLQRTLDLTPERVNAVARQYLGPNRLVARVTPLGKMDSSQSDLAQKVDRTVMPGPGQDRPLQLPARQRFSLANGLEVILAEHHKLPLVHLSLLVRSGSATDPEDKPGLMALMADLLTQGANGRDAVAFGEAVERLGAALGAGADTEATGVQMDVLRQNFEEALKLFADAIVRPDFPQEEFDRQKARKTVALKQQQDQPAAVAGIVLNKVLAAGTPFGHLPNGTIQGLERMGLADVRAAWKNHFVPANATLIVTGDLTRAEIEGPLNQVFAAWKDGAAPRQQAQAPAPHGSRTIYLVDKPGAPQSVIAAGLLGQPRKTPDFAFLELFNTIFGGQFNSRLNLNLRENKGYTYGARSAFNFGRTTGFFSLNAPVQTKVTADAIREAVTELEGITGSQPPTEKELNFAKGVLIDGYGRRFVSLAGIAQEIGQLSVLGLPDSELENYPKTLRSIEPPKVAEVGKKAVHPENLAIVVVGDAKTIRPDLEQLNLGPVVELTSEGVPVTAR